MERALASRPERNEEDASIFVASDNVAWKIVMEGDKPHHAAARKFISQLTKHNPLERAALTHCMAALTERVARHGH